MIRTCGMTRTQYRERVWELTDRHHPYKSDRAFQKSHHDTP